MALDNCDCKVNFKFSSTKDQSIVFDKGLIPASHCGFQLLSQ